MDSSIVNDLQNISETDANALERFADQLYLSLPHSKIIFLQKAIDLVNAKDRITKLPIEILFKIFSYLDPLDEIECALVCKEWHRKLAHTAGSFDRFIAAKLSIRRHRADGNRTAVLRSRKLKNNIGCANCGRTETVADQLKTSTDLNICNFPGTPPVESDTDAGASEELRNSQSINNGLLKAAVCDLLNDERTLFGPEFEDGLARFTNDNEASQQSRCFHLPVRCLGKDDYGMDIMRYHGCYDGVRGRVTDVSLDEKYCGVLWQDNSLCIWKLNCLLIDNRTTISPVDPPGGSSYHCPPEEFPAYTFHLTADKEFFGGIKTELRLEDREPLPLLKSEPEAATTCFEHIKVVKLQRQRLLGQDWKNKEIQRDKNLNGERSLGKGKALREQLIIFALSNRSFHVILMELEVSEKIFMHRDAELLGEEVKYSRHSATNFPLFHCGDQTTILCQSNIVTNMEENGSLSAWFMVVTVDPSVLDASGQHLPIGRSKPIHLFHACCHSSDNDCGGSSNLSSPFTIYVDSVEFDNIQLFAVGKAFLIFRVFQFSSTPRRSSNYKGTDKLCFYDRRRTDRRKKGKEDSSWKLCFQVDWTEYVGMMKVNVDLADGFPNTNEPIPLCLRSLYYNGDFDPRFILHYFDCAEGAGGGR